MRFFVRTKANTLKDNSKTRTTMSDKTKRSDSGGDSARNYSEEPLTQEWTSDTDTSSSQATEEPEDRESSDATKRGTLPALKKRLNRRKANLAI